MLAVQKMLDELGLHFPKRLEEGDAEVAWVASWVKAFKNFEPWILESATQRIIENRTERSHPIISDVKKVCYEIQREEAASKPPMPVHHEQQHPDPFALADHLINCQLGRTAARDNPSWIVPLHDFCREFKRLPYSSEIEQLKRIAHNGEQIEHAFAIGKVHDLHNTLAASRNALRLRREKLRRRLLGDRADDPVPSTFQPDDQWMDRERALYRAKLTERDRLAAEWRDRVCAEYGSVDRFLTIKRPK